MFAPSAVLAEHGADRDVASAEDTQTAAGDLEAATGTWRRSLDILDQPGHPDAEQVKTRLDRAGTARRRP